MSLEAQIKEFKKNNIYGSSRVNLTIENSFLKHISTESGFKSWLDIENEYYKFLCYPLNLGTANHDSHYLYANISKLNSDFDYIKNKLEDFLKNLISQKDIKSLDKIKEIIFSSIMLKDLSEDGRKELANREHSKITQYYKKEFPAEELKLSRKTIPYVEEYMHCDEKDFEQELLQDNISINRFDLFPDNVLFLNFNYTDLESLYIDDETENVEVIHIHGELGNTDNPIIFGYGDELEESYGKLENLNDNKFLENIKSIKYQETDNYKKLLSFLNIDKYQILILGHSCGNSDRTLLNTIFEHENCVSIKPYYFQENKTDNYSDIVRNISRSFTNKKSMRDKVVNKKYSDYFSMK